MQAYNININVQDVRDNLLPHRHFPNSEISDFANSLNMNSSTVSSLEMHKICRRFSRPCPPLRGDSNDKKCGRISTTCNEKAKKHCKGHSLMRSIFRVFFVREFRGVLSALRWKRKWHQLKLSQCTILKQARYGKQQLNFYQNSERREICWTISLPNDINDPVCVRESF